MANRLYNKQVTPKGYKSGGKVMDSARDAVKKFRTKAASEAMKRKPTSSGSSTKDIFKSYGKYDGKPIELKNGGRIEKVPGGYSKEGSGRISDKGLKGRSPTEAFKQKEMFKSNSNNNMRVKKAMGGSLKPVDKNKNPGLAKLPTQVRNKMGYMKDGGKVMREAGLNVGETLKQFKDLMTGSKDSKMSKQKEGLKKQIAEAKAQTRDRAKVKK